MAPPEPGDVTFNASQLNGVEIASSKIHIRGLDDLTTQDIKTYCLQYFDCAPERIEWIDDTSANVVYADEGTALQALSALTAETSLSTDMTALRAAKSVPSLAGSRLEVRIALSTDRKRPRAHETSRFYLLHPEHDPREQRRKQRSRNVSERAYRRRRYSDEENERRARRDLAEGFDASMYDDFGPATRSIGAADSSPPTRHSRRVDSYRPQRRRSASPMRDKEEDRGLLRTRSPSAQHRSFKGSHPAQNNQSKELLPDKIPKRTKDLFSDHLASAEAKKELFPHKMPISNHRRTDAIDAADETADLFAGKFSVPFTDGSSETKSSRGILGGNHSQGLSSDGISIRGASSQGIAIKGGATHVGTIKELFPGKANTGKELFAEKLPGRGIQRMRAHDLFS